MKVIVELAFIDEIRVISVDRLKFDSNLKISPGVDSEVDLSKSSLINFPDNFEIFANFLKHLRHV